MTAPTPENVLDLHREISIMFLKSSSAFAVRTPRGQKDPGATNWDPRTNSREKSNETIHVVSTTTDNLGVHLFGSTVDVDIDTDNPILLTALDYFLPHTNHVWGRKSRPRTHRLYELAGLNNSFDPSQFPFLNHIQAVSEIALEVRGGEMKSGRYSLLPGSVHPSGEVYEWSDLKAARSTPVQTDIVRLMDAIRFSCVAALLVPYWVEGSRNDLCKALSGFMFRASSYTQELDIGLTFDKQKARLLLDGILAISDDDPSDHNARVKTFEQTWEKGANGAAVTGATRIAEITGKQELIHLLYLLLAYTPDLIQLEKMFEQYVVLRNTTNIVDLNLGSKGNYIMNKEAFVFTLAGQYLTTPNGRVPVSAVYVNSLQRTIVDKISIHPARDKVFEDDEGVKVANVWSGWGIPPAAEATEEDVEPFLRYLRTVIARDDDALFQWVLTWLADVFQNPASKPGTALVLVGKQGAGKTFLFENVMRPIIGDAHFIKAGTTERLTSKFNASMSGKLFIQGEEVVNSNRRMDAEALKDAITSAKRTIEFKGRDSFEMDDHARYGFTSNHLDNAVHIGVGDRRFTVAHVSDEFAYDQSGKKQPESDEFWTAMFKWAQERPKVPHRENLAKLHRYFLSLEIDRKKIMRAHETKAKRSMRQTSSKGIDSWLHSMLELTNPFDSMRENDRGNGHSFSRNRKQELLSTDGWPEYTSYALLEASLKQFSSKDYGEGRSAQQIAKFFKDNKLIDNTLETRTRFAGRRVRVRPFPSRESIHAYLIAQGYDVLENSADDGPEEPEDREF